MHLVPCLFMPAYEAGRRCLGERFRLFAPAGRTECISEELLLAVREKGAVGSLVVFPFGVKPCKGSPTGLNAKDSLNHMVLWGKGGLDVGTEAYFVAYVVFASPGVS